jgi:aspartyl-tRNA(Asn)/glutamyl-tRNA(Gln) amidotransferase subunit A
MGRSVADCSALLQAMSAPGPGVGLDPLPDTPRPGPKPLAGLRIATSDRPATMEVERPVADAFDRAVSACKELGARIVAEPTPAKLDWDDLSRIMFTEVWTYHAQFEARHELYRPALAEFVEAAAGFTDAQAYVRATWRRAELTAVWHDWLEDQRIDLVIEPTLPITPYERGPGYDRGHAGGPGDPMIGLTALWDMTGMPVVSLPVEWNAGVSLIAARGREEVAIQAGIDLQEHALAIPQR